MHCRLQPESVASSASIERFASKIDSKMHFPLILSVILVYFSVSCNAQFKIIGVLDTKSENNNGDVKSIRTIDEVDEKFPLNDGINKGRGLIQTVNISDIVDDNKENVNFIKPYEAVTNELKKDLVDTTSEISDKNETLNASVGGEGGQYESVIVKDSSSEKYPDHDVEVTTRSSTTIGAKVYRKSFQPNIRKFSYIEARSFHHPDSTNNLSPSRWNNYKFIKVLKYRNKYKSKCRCERIWNCPKIQISIQRCEPDYFMCCF